MFVSTLIQLHSCLINRDLVFVCFALEYFTVDWNFIMLIVMNSFAFIVNVLSFRLKQFVYFCFR